MKKIIAVIGSPKKFENSYTANFTNEFIERVKGHYNDVEAEIITLGEKNIAMCKGCLSCKENGFCRIEDDLPYIIEKIKTADFIIFASPVYISQTSALLRTSWTE